MPQEKKVKNEGQLPDGQNIPEEVLKQLPPEVKAQLGVVEEQKPIFRTGESSGLSDSIDRLREGFEKIGLTLIGRMGEFASTLERVVMTVGRIEKVEKSTAETTYFLKNLQKILDEFKRDFSKVVDKIDTVEILVERMQTEISNIKNTISSGVISPSTPPTAHVTSSIPTNFQTTTPIPSVKPSPSPASSPSSASPSPPPDTSSSSTPSSTPATPLDSVFQNLFHQIRVGMNTRLVADALDQAREQISEVSKWTPAIYELGKIARNLRRTETLLSEQDFNKITEILNQCKSQI
ncbi:MAG: hypothetical protein ACTSRS_11220 [Candidatus Helarchaeota archaeon]